MSGSRKKSTAGVSQIGDSPPEKSVASGHSTDTIEMHQRLQHRRLQKGKQPMQENSAQEEEMCVHNREIDQNDNDQEEDGGGEETGEMEEEEEGADEQRPKLPDGCYWVEAIRSKRKFRGVTQYFVKWCDWPESENTWEPRKNLQSCPDLIKAFEESSQSGKRRSGRRGRRRHGVNPKPQSTKKKQERPQQLTGASLPSAVVMDALNTVEAQTGPIMDSLNSVETEAAAMVDSSNPVDENVDKADDVSERAQVSPLDNEGKKEVDYGSRSENLDKSDDVSVNVQEPAAPESVALMNEVASADGQDASQSGRPVSSSRAADNEQGETIRTSTNSIQNSGLDFDNAEYPLTKVIKVIGYSAPASDTTQEVDATFLAMRSDRKEEVVTNKYLKAHYPLLLIDFYEQHFRYAADRLL